MRWTVCFYCGERVWRGSYRRIVHPSCLTPWRAARNVREHIGPHVVWISGL